MAQTRLTIAKRDIAVTVRQERTRVFTQADIERILRENRVNWRLAQSTTVAEFIGFLAKAVDLRHVRLEFPGRATSRYVLGEAPMLQIVQSLKPEGYFTHYTAMRLHGLTDQIPKTVYLNFEQRATGGGGALSQDAIDRAFSRPCRVSNNKAVLGKQTIVLLNGQNTARLGVVEIESDEGARLQVSNVERTLIDATVRPIYSGGVFEVLRAFQAAHDQVSINKLVAMLRTLNFTYPYHQAIGFYLERSGAYRSSQIELLRKRPFEFDFYLAHAMREIEYVASWRLFVPKGF
ncbi:MAG TPA: hypothetical protein VML55_22475 [Planctomycetaceae bacterium]|nr:hypothetical protein [Planctomycetaceae bacterium]